MTTSEKKVSARSSFFRGAADRIGSTELGLRILRVLSKNKTLQRIMIGGPNPIHLWEDDLVFQKLISNVKPFTLLTEEALFTIYQTASGVRTITGDIAEIGVYKGGTAWLLGSIFSESNRSLLMFDTFAGMPDSADSIRDLHKEGDFSDTSLAAVTKLLSSWPNAIPVAGFFPATATPFAQHQFAFVHIDVDIYQSVLDCCDFFYPRLSTGGVLVFDDYGQRSCPGAKQAVDEFFASRPETPFYLRTGQCVVWKLA